MAPSPDLESVVGAPSLYSADHLVFFSRHRQNRIGGPLVCPSRALPRAWLAPWICAPLEGWRAGVSISWWECELMLHLAVEYELYCAGSSYNCAPLRSLALPLAAGLTCCLFLR